MLHDVYVQKFVDLERQKADKFFKIYERLLDQLLEKDLSKEPLHRMIESMDAIECQLKKYQDVEIKRDNPESVYKVEFNTVESWNA